MKYTLLIREVDRQVFESIKKGEKTIETRAATLKYQQIHTGDTLEFVCGQDKLVKQVGEIRLFKTIDEMVSNLDYKKVMPFVKTIEDMKQVYISFPGYEDKLNQFGLVAFSLK